MQKIGTQKVIPLKLVVKFEPPLIGMLYKRNEKDKKRYLYNILLNTLINLEDSEQITSLLFQEHPQFLDPKIIGFQQVQSLVQKILEFMQYQDSQGNEQELLQMQYEQLLNQGYSPEEIIEYFRQQGIECQAQDDDEEETPVQEQPKNNKQGRQQKGNTSF